MRNKKYYIALDDFERRVIFNCLNEMRNKFIANSKYTDAVDKYPFTYSLIVGTNSALQCGHSYHFLRLLL